MPGDLWLLGKHRLLCGDSTNADDVERVLDGVKPHLLVTDPPYGVSYDPAWREQLRRSRSRSWPRARCSTTTAPTGARPGRCFPATSPMSGMRALHAATVAASLEACGFADPLADHLGQDPAGDRPRRLSLAARAGLVCRQEGQDGPLGGRPQADHRLGDPAPQVADGPRHREAGRVHEAADREQLLAGPGGLRAVLAARAPRSSPPR